MTIKRRLSISNIFMIIIPVFISIGISYTFMILFESVNPYSVEKELKLYISNEGSQNELGEENLKRKVDSFNSSLSNRSRKVSIFKDGKPYYAVSEQTVLESKETIEKMISNGITGFINAQDSEIFIEHINNYSIVMVDTGERGFDRHFSYYPMIVLLCSTIIVIITNLILTKFVVRHITVPLKTLDNGVKEIIDGNLDIRIEHKKNDEFAPICKDFNEMAARLQESVKRQQKDENNRKELLAGISHDLRTPLTSIRAYVEGLLDGVADDPAVQLRYLKTVQTKAKDIDSIVDKLFLFSKLDIGEHPFYPEKVDIGNELISMVEAYGYEYDHKGISLNLLQNVQNIFVYVDPLQLRNAITNILENSMKYKTKDRGTIYISCYEEELNVKLVFTDDGPGVPEEYIERLFDVFYRGDLSRNNPSNGSGLGLAITSKILELLGGSIKAENATGGGLTLTLLLPKYIQEV